MQNNSDHLRFRRRGIGTPGEREPKNRFAVMLTIATAAIIVPAMVYGFMHPDKIDSTVKQIARHVPVPVKDLRVAIVATRTTPAPKPSPTSKPEATAVPASKPQAIGSSAHAAHNARLRRLLALRAARAKKLAASGLSSDVADRSGNEVAGQAPVQTKAAAATAATNGTSGANAAPAAAQAPEADATPVYAPDVVVDARFTRQVQPDYPEIARSQGVQGTAVVLATIGPDGKVVSARIDQSTGDRMLDDAALAAARQSGFQPPIIDGKPATETYRLVYTFSL